MRNLIKLIDAGKRLMCVYFGYTVYSEEYNVTHYTMSWIDAYECAQCYKSATIKDSTSCFFYIAD